MDPFMVMEYVALLQKTSNEIYLKICIVHRA